jgi:hypothetical protein
MYLKGILLAYGRRQEGHELPQMVGYGGQMGIAGLIAISQNADQMTLLRELGLVYESLRFSEDAGFNIENKNIVMFLDELALNFEKMYAEKLKEVNPIRLYVHETLKERFFRHNDFFTPEMVSNNSKAGFTTNVEEMPEIPIEDARKSFTVTSVQARGVMGNLRGRHLQKRASKEDMARQTPAKLVNNLQIDKAPESGSREVAGKN